VEAQIEEIAECESSPTAMATSLNERIGQLYRSMDQEVQRRVQGAQALHALPPAGGGRRTKKQSPRKASPKAAVSSNGSCYSSPSMSKLGRPSFESGTLSSTLRRFATEEETASPSYACFLRAGDSNAASVNKFIQDIGNRGSGNGTLSLAPRSSPPQATHGLELARSITSPTSRDGSPVAFGSGRPQRPGEALRAHSLSIPKMGRRGEIPGCF
jgi:hypothetical protein